jgi:hypothetical protein
VKIIEGSLGNKARYPKMILLKMKRDNSQVIHSLGLKEIENDMKKGKDSPKKQLRSQQISSEPSGFASICARAIKRKSMKRTNSWKRQNFSTQN